MESRRDDRALHGRANATAVKRLPGRDWFPGPQPSRPLASILQSALDVTRRGAARHVVQREHLSKSETGVERRVKAGVDRLQVGERKLL